MCVYWNPYLLQCEAPCDDARLCNDYSGGVPRVVLRSDEVGCEAVKELRDCPQNYHTEYDNP